MFSLQDKLGIPKSWILLDSQSKVDDGKREECKYKQISTEEKSKI